MVVCAIKIVLNIYYNRALHHIEKTTVFIQILYIYIILKYSLTMKRVHADNSPMTL